MTDPDVTLDHVRDLVEELGGHAHIDRYEHIAAIWLPEADWSGAVAAADRVTLAREAVAKLRNGLQTLTMRATPVECTELLRRLGWCLKWRAVVRDGVTLHPVTYDDNVKARWRDLLLQALQRHPALAAQAD